MNVYINDKYLNLAKAGEGEFTDQQPDTTLSSLHQVTPSGLRGVVLLENTSQDDLAMILNWIEFKKVPDLRTMVCLTNDYELHKSYIKKQFRIVKAAGGLVRKRDKFLLIYRLEKWDLPKGKLEKGERSKEAAVREVFEECGVEAELVGKLCTTWHTYMQEGKRILKKTTWYNMNCIDDSNMEPQYVENIEDIRWMTLEQVHKALKNSYRSIQGVVEAWSRHNEEVG